MPGPSIVTGCFCMPNGLTVLATLRQGEEERLRQVLRAIGDDIKGRRWAGPSQRPHIHFSASRTIHFARFAILDDPDRGPDRMRLLFSSNYDGDLESHLAELIEITSDMDAIWGSCEGYAGIASFPAFVRMHSQEPGAFYLAFRNENIGRIRRAIEARRRIQARLEVTPPPTLESLLEAVGARLSSGVVSRVIETSQRIVARIRQLARALPLVLDVMRAIVRLGFLNVFSAAQGITASLNRYAIIRLVNWATRNHMAARKSSYSSLAIDTCGPVDPPGAGDELPSAFGRGTPPTFREDVVTQNQLTLVTVVVPQHIDHVKAVLAGIDAYAKRLAPPGSLSGISTIHFVRWLLIDEDRRLVMLSDYDGSWESYIDEFAEMILSGLDAIWGTSVGYPQDGARDLPAFKRFLRSHQVPSEVFFSAYPEATLLNIGQDLRLARALSHGIRHQVRRLLQGV